MSSNAVILSPTELTTVLAILIIVFFLGSIGNSLVILVYRRRSSVEQMSTDRFFILAMAICDLCVCCVVVPSQIYMEIVAYQISNVFCKLQYVISVTNVLFSTLLISAIAFDRFLSITYPLRNIISIDRAKCLIIVLGVAALVMGFPVAVSVRTQYRAVPTGASVDNGTVANWTMALQNDSLVLPTSANASNTFTDVENNNTDLIARQFQAGYNNNTVVYSLVGTCDEVEFDKHLTYAQRLAYKIFKLMLQAIYVTSILSVIVCYSLIYRVILKIQRRGKMLRLNSSHHHHHMSAAASVAAVAVKPAGNVQTSPGGEIASLSMEISVNLSTQRPRQRQQFKKSSVFIEKTDHQKNRLNFKSFKLLSSRTQKACKDNSADDVYQNSMPQILHQHKDDNCEKKRAPDTNARKPTKSRVAASFARRQLANSTAFQNVKSAMILCVVAIVYMIAFVPVLLINLGCIRFNVIIYDWYFINNAANPLIYCFMNSTFRRDLWAVLCRSMNRSSSMLMLQNLSNCSNNAQQKPKPHHRDQHQHQNQHHSQSQRQESTSMNPQVHIGL